MNINIPRTSGGTFYWRVGGEQNAPRIVFWEETNTSVEVPFGEWVTAEVYYKMGNQNTGRFTFSIQKAGGPKQTVFDVTNWTYHPQRQPEGVYRWNPHKLYTDPRNVDFVRTHGGVMQVYWDDWQVWTAQPSPPLAGDLTGDGQVTLTDLVMQIKMLAGIVPPNLDRADLDGNGALTLADVCALIRLLVKA